MPDQLHSLLRRQLKRCFGSLDDVPDVCRPFIEAVDAAYKQADLDRVMLERSLDLSSEELSESGSRLREAVVELQAAHADMEARVVERTRALETANERLRQSQKMEAIGQLAGGVAHDFNNLLQVIGGSTELLAAGVRDPADRDELDEIRKAARRAAALTQQLLAFSRKQVLEPQVVDINQVLANLQQMLSRVIRENIALLFVPLPGPAWICVDPNQIEQVFLNLVLNSRDALPHGGYIRMEVSAEQPGPDAWFTPVPDTQYVRLRVVDNGIGMPPDVRDRVFEPFFTTKESGKGTGLGLASVYGIVRQSNGFISVDSREGGGTTFTMFFAAARPLELSGQEAAAPASHRGNRETVLLVEDEHAVRRIIRAMLQRYGYDVLEAATWQEAHTHFDEQSQHIQLLVTDVIMPEMNGPTLAQQFLARKPQLRVLFISGYTDLDPAMLGLENPNLSFLAKPIQAAQLATKVRDLLVRA